MTFEHKLFLAGLIIMAIVVGMLIWSRNADLPTALVSVCVFVTGWLCTVVGAYGIGNRVGRRETIEEAHAWMAKMKRLVKDDECSSL
jgi:hypothetical protein